MVERQAMRYGVSVTFKNVRAFDQPLKDAFSDYDGSGYCLMSGERDFSWTRENLYQANRLYNAVKALARKLKVRVKVTVFELS